MPKSSEIEGLQAMTAEDEELVAAAYRWRPAGVTFGDVWSVGTTPPRESSGWTVERLYDEATVQRLSTELQELRAALSELVDTLTPAEGVPIKDPHYGDMVRALGRRIGFGALMSAASGEWRAALAEDGDPLGGEFVSGPCRAVLEHDLARARAALKLGDAK